MALNTIVVSDAGTGDGRCLVRVVYGVQNGGEEAGEEISSRVVTVREAAEIVWEALTGEKVTE